MNFHLSSRSLWRPFLYKSASLTYSILLFLLNRKYNQQPPSPNSLSSGPNWISATRESILALVAYTRKVSCQYKNPYSARIDVDGSRRGLIPLSRCRPCQLSQASLHLVTQSSYTRSDDLLGSNAQSNDVFSLEPPVVEEGTRTVGSDTTVGNKRFSGAKQVNPCHQLHLATAGPFNPDHFG